MNILLHGFSDAITHELTRQGLDVAVWIRPGGRENANAAALAQLAKTIPLIIKGRDFIERVSDLKPQHPLPVSLYEELRRVAFQPFMRCHARRYQCRMLRQDFVFHEHAFMAFALRCHDLLKRNRINTLAFAQVPHKGADVVLYFLARLMGLQTLLGMQNPALAPDAFTFVSSIEEIGAYEGMPHGEGVPVDISPPRERPFYTRRYRKKYQHAAKELMRAATRALWAFLTLRPRSSRVTHLDKVCRAWRRLTFLLRQPPEGVTHPDELEHLMQQPYVYVPLHLEPEMVIDVLGGKYREQALFVMKLRQQLPEDVAIIVKENPAQTTYARDHHFVETLLALKNVHYIRHDADTFMLMKRTLAVAAVLGTAGWEALRLGKPVIRGGHAWYGGLPGVFHVDVVSYTQLQDFTFDEVALKAAAQDMGQRHGRGVLANFSIYRKVLPAFDEQENARSVARHLLTALAHYGTEMPAHAEKEVQSG